MKRFKNCRNEKISTVFIIFSLYNDNISMCFAWTIFRIFGLVCDAHGATWSIILT